MVQGEIVGVGTGSTVNKFIDALATIKDRHPRRGVQFGRVDRAPAGAGHPGVRRQRGRARLAVYIDGADEIDGRGYMIKGGGAALTREKIVAAQSRRFVCIADASKRVNVLGAFPLPVEVIPMAAQRLVRQFAALGGMARVRDEGRRAAGHRQRPAHPRRDGPADHRPAGFESEVNQWPGVVTVGVFAHQRAARVPAGHRRRACKTLRFD